MNKKNILAIMMLGLTVAFAQPNNDQISTTISFHNMAIPYSSPLSGADSRYVAYSLRRSGAEIEIRVSSGLMPNNTGESVKKGPNGMPMTEQKPREPLLDRLNALFENWKSHGKTSADYLLYELSKIIGDMGLSEVEGTNKGEKVYASSTGLPVLIICKGLDAIDGLGALRVFSQKISGSRKS